MKELGVVLETEPLEQAEVDEVFRKVANARWANIVATGKTMSWEAAKAWLEARARGERPPKPVAHKPGR